jgi:hypothetical protein
MYKVIKVGRISQCKQILKRNVTEEEARKIVESYPNSNRSMVYYIRM